jgi:thiamine-monophosphate kinase
VSGTVGGARAGLEMLQAGPGDAPLSAAAQACCDRHLRPEARVRLGIAVARGGAARAAMDLSDGLADAVRQLAEASGCGARIDAAAIPVDPGAREWWHGRGVDVEEAAIVGGEDYELLLAVPPRWKGRLRHVRQQVARPALTRIGTLTRSREIVQVRSGHEQPWPIGFEHFRGSDA